MKFKLIEHHDNNQFAHKALEEKVLNEKTDIYYELATYLLPDISNNKHNPRGFISHLGEGKKQELASKLSTYVRDKYGVNDSKEISDRVNEILNAWVVHHINGVHPDSYRDISNCSQNIALIDGVSLHEKITQRYKEEIARCVQNIPVQINDDVDKLLLRLLVVCKETHVDVKDILAIDMSDFEKVLYSIPEKLTQFFYANYPRASKDIIYLSDLNLSW